MKRMSRMLTDNYTDNLLSGYPWASLFTCRCLLHPANGIRVSHELDFQSRGNAEYIWINTNLVGS